MSIRPILNWSINRFFLAKEDYAKPFLWTLVWQTQYRPRDLRGSGLVAVHFTTLTVLLSLMSADELPIMISIESLSTTNLCRDTSQ